MAGQTFSGSARTTADAGSIWAQLDDAATWEGISGVDEVFDEVRDSLGHLNGFRFYSTAMGQRYTGTASPGPRTEGESLSWNIETPDLRGSITVTLSTEGDETAVDVSLAAEPVSMMARMGFPLIASAIGNGFQHSVDRFVEQFGI